MALHQKMFVALVLGAGLGLLLSTLFPGAPWLLWIANNVTYVIGQLWLRALLMLVVPLLFAALVVGIAELDLKQVGRLGLRTLGYTVVVSSVAVLIGVSLVHLIRPGEIGGATLRAKAAEQAARVGVPTPPATSGADALISLVPNNPIKAAADGDMVGIIIFSIVFAIGLTLAGSKPSDRLRVMITGLYDVMMKLVEVVIRAAPIGVAMLLFTMTTRMGIGVLAQIGAYVGTVLLGLGLHLVVVYSLSVRFLGGRSPIGFFRDVKLAMTTAFSTASSSATLPTALKVAEENLRLPRHVSRFVLTAGSTMNQNGTALFEGVTVLFLAQLYGVELTLQKQALIMGICILAGIGTAGVPAGSIPVIAMILKMFGIPAEGLVLILGVDRLLDMCRTTLNVTGDLAAAVFVARGEAHAVPSEPGPGEGLDRLASDPRDPDPPAR